jgi:hypothetical protein
MFSGDELVEHFAAGDLFDNSGWAPMSASGLA